MMASLTVAILVIVATFGIETAFGSKHPIIQFSDNTNLGNGVVTIFNKDGNVGNVKVVDIYDKEENKRTRIVTIRDKDMEISINEDKCIVSFLDEKREGKCTGLDRMQTDIPAEVAVECEDRDVYIEKSKPCGAVSFSVCGNICVDKCWNCWGMRCCGKVCYNGC